jgi:hypothetical protein
VSGSAENAAFLGRECVSVLRGVDEPIALVRRQATHAANRPVDGLAAIGRQLSELLEELTRLLLLIRSQVLPGFHPVEHAFLLLRRQAGEMLQPASQSRLLLRRKPAELGIVFERAALLRGRQILVAAEPVSGVAGLVLRRMGWIRAAGVGATFFLKVVPLPVRLRMRLLGRSERRRQQQKHCQTAPNCRPSQHVWSPARSRILRIRDYVVLHLQIVKHVEIGVQFIVFLQRLQIADGSSRLNWQTERGRIGRDGS